MTRRLIGLLLTVTAVAALLTGCFGGGRKQISSDPAQLLEEARAKFEKKKYFSAREIINILMVDPSATPAVIAEGQILLADTYFFDKGFQNLTEAQSRYQSFISFHPRHEKIDYAQFQLGMCLFLQVLNPDRDQLQTLKAIEEFQKIEDLYPGSPYIEPARVKILECRDRIAEHEFVVGRYYMKKDAHDAALQRFLVIHQNYPSYTRREKLYFYMARAYRGMGRREKAREFLKRILQEFPEGKYAKEARRDLKKIKSD